MNEPPALARILLSAAAYALAGFAAGFALAPIRIIVLEPRIGPLAAVLVEAPMVLLASLLAAKGVLRRVAPGARAGQRAVLGALAFFLLQGAEFGLSLALGRTPSDFAAGYTTAAGAVGLTAQVVFGLIPLLIRTGPPRVHSR